MAGTIQARADYRSKFGAYRYRVEIIDGDGATENIRDYEITPEGITLEYEGDQENAYQNIVPSTGTFTLVCTTQAQVTFLRTIAESASGQYGVRVLRAGTTSTPVITYWVGTIVADQLNFSDALPQAVTVVATDDLGYLEDKPYLQADGSRYTGSATITQHLLNCLGKLRYASWYYDDFFTFGGVDYYPNALSLGKNLLPNNYVSASGTVDLYDETTLTHTGFYSEDPESGGAKSTYYVLEEILKHFNAQASFGFMSTGHYLNVTPTGAMIKYAIDGTALAGFKYRFDGALAATAPDIFATLAIDNDANNKPRLTGGQFSYAQPYNKVTREAKWFATLADVQYFLNEGADFEQEYTTASAYATGDQFRLTGACGFSISGVGSAETVYNFTTGSNNPAPLNYHIGRIRVRIRLRFEKSGNDLYLRRGLQSGAQVPLYETYGDVTAAQLPIYYTDIQPAEEVSFQANGTQYYYVQCSPPFDVTESQLIQVPIDVITPELPNDTTAIKVLVQAQYLLPDNTVAEHYITGNGFAYTDLYVQPNVNVRLFPFDGFGLDDGETFTATNAIDHRRTLDIGTSEVNDQLANSNFSTLRYREGNGFYQPATLGYTTLLETTGALNAAERAVQEVASLYSKPRFLYEGDIIKEVITLQRLLTIVDGTTTYKLKPLQISYATGLEVATVTAMELGQSSSTPVVVGLPNGVPDPLPPPPAPDVVNRLAATQAATAITFSPSAEAYNAQVLGADRTGQVGSNITALNASGQFVEISDGTNGQVLTTDGQGRYNFTTVSGGGGSTTVAWHGYTSVVLYPTDFMANDDGNRGSIHPEVIEDDTSLTLGVRCSSTLTELYAFAPIPDGYKATHVQIYASASTAAAVRCFAFNHSSGAITTNANGQGALNASINIDDITGSTTSALAVKVSPASTSTFIYGAIITLATV